MVSAVGVFKCLIIFINVLFSILGVGLAILVCATTFVEKSIDIDQGEDKIDPTGFAIALIVIGLITLIITFCGCFGVFRQNTCMMITYSVILLIFFIIQLVIIVFVFIAANAIGEAGKTQVEKIFEKEDIQKIMDFEAEYECCGLNGPTDLSFNQGCCKGYSEKKICHPNDLKNVWQNGCVEEFTSVVLGAFLIFEVICCGLAILEITGSILGFVYVCLIKRRSY